MDPSLLMAASSVLGKSMASAPSGPSSAYQQNPSDWGFDSSGWNVNFGGGSITSQATKTESDPMGLAGLTSGLSMNWPVIAMVGLGVVAVWMITRKR